MQFLKFVLFVFFVQLIGCTSSTYGSTFVPIPTNNVASSNQYTLKVYTGGFAGADYAKKDLEREAQDFMKKNPQFVSYKIISEKFEMIPSGVTFVVEFMTKK